MIIYLHAPDSFPFDRPLGLPVTPILGGGGYWRVRVTTNVIRRLGSKKPVLYI